MSLYVVRVVVLFTAFISVCQAQSQTEQTNDFEAEHERGVNLARQGKLDEGLNILQRLIDQHPDDYSLQRDYVIIATWKGRCDIALERYQKIHHYDRQEPYLIVPVSECLADRKSYKSAIALLRKGRQWWPDDEDVKNTLNSVLADSKRDSMSEVEVAVSTNESDQGSREWLFQTQYSKQLFDRTRVHLRYLTVRATDSQFDTGDLNRIGLGVRYGLNPFMTVGQEFSFDAKRGDRFGSNTLAVFTPSDLWLINMEYASFAEDISLRATAQDIKASRLTVNADFHTVDYKWNWSASSAWYGFSDTNDRTVYSSSLGYAFELKPEREQRLILQLYHTQNTLANTVYYNPESDLSTILTYKVDIVYSSRFQRHVDHFYLFAGTYYEKGYGTENVGGVRYEQEYDFNETTSLNFGLSYSNNVYDGNSESDAAFDLTFNKRF